jgi:predicted nucleic acid-binding protein
VRLYFDSSAFAKRYIQESGSDAVIDWCDRATELAIAGIALPEIISAFCRLRREGKLGDGQYRQLKAALFADIDDIAICDPTPEVILAAIECLETNILRGMDAIHIGCALEWRAEVFISADSRQCEAAERAGLKVEMV